MKMKRLAAVLLLACITLLSGCDAEQFVSASSLQLPEGLVSDGCINVNIGDAEYTLDTSDPDAVLAAIESAKAAQSDVSEENQEPEMDIESQKQALRDFLIASGVNEAAVQQAMESIGENQEIPFPGMGIIKSIWEANGVTTDQMYENYDAMVEQFKSIGINLDIASFQTGFGTVGELCETILGDVTSIPGIVQDAVNSESVQ